MTQLTDSRRPHRFRSERRHMFATCTDCGLGISAHCHTDYEDATARAREGGRGR